MIDSPSVKLAEYLRREQTALDNAARALGEGRIALSSAWCHEAKIERQEAEKWAKVA